MNCKVKSYFLLSILIVGAVVGCGIRGSTPPLNSDQLNETISFSPPKAKEWRIDNGLTVVYLEDEELPITYGSLYLPGGTYWQNEKEMGTVAAMGSLLRDGGAGRYSAAQLDAELDKLAAGISSSFSSEWGRVNFSCLDKDLEAVFAMFADVVLRPKFSVDKLELWKGDNVDAILRRVEEPNDVAQLSFMQLVYGDTPFGRISTTKDIRKISRADLQTMYSRFVKPAKAILTIGGNVSQAKVNELLDKYFGQWHGAPKLPPLPKELPKPLAGVYFVSLPVTQSSIVMGHSGPPRLTPDYPAIDVFNEIFGSSGFGLSRLFSRIRTELGLAYSVYGAIRPGLVQGSNMIMVQTKSETTNLAISESIKVLSSLQSQRVPVNELNEVKKSVVNSYVFNFDSTSAILGRRAVIKLMEFPDNFDETYLPKLKAVTVEDVQKVAADRWDSSNFVVVVVGNEDAYDLLQKYMAEKGNPLSEMQLRKVKFDQKLLL